MFKCDYFQRDSELQYFLIDLTNSFRMEQDTGIVYVVNTELLDREVMATFKLTVSVIRAGFRWR